MKKMFNVNKQKSSCKIKYSNFLSKRFHLKNQQSNISKYSMGGVRGTTKKIGGFSLHDFFGKNRSWYWAARLRQL